MIERFNRILSEALSKLEEVYDWNKFVKPNSTKMTSYFLIYDRTVRLSMEGEVFSKSILLDKVIILIHKLLLFRESARIAIKRA